MSELMDWNVLLKMESTAGAMSGNMTTLDTCFANQPVASNQPATGLRGATQQTIPLARFADDEAIHPMAFIKTMEAYFCQQHIPPQQWIRLTLQQLDDMPRDWGSAFESSWSDWPSFRQSFVDLFWSEGRQDLIEYRLYNTYYDATIHHSMTDFAKYWMQQVEHFDSPMTCRRLIHRLRCMLPEHVEEAILVARIITMDEMLSLLGDLDAAAARRLGRTSYDEYDAVREKTTLLVNNDSVVTVPTPEPQTVPATTMLADDSVVTVPTPEPQAVPATTLLADDSVVTVPTSESKVVPVITPLATDSSDVCVPTTDLSTPSRETPAADVCKDVVIPTHCVNTETSVKVSMKRSDGQYMLTTFSRWLHQECDFAQNILRSSNTDCVNNNYVRLTFDRGR